MSLFSHPPVGSSAGTGLHVALIYGATPARAERLRVIRYQNCDSSNSSSWSKHISGICAPFHRFASFGCCRWENETFIPDGNRYA